MQKLFKCDFSDFLFFENNQNQKKLPLQHGSFGVETLDLSSDVIAPVFDVIAFEFQSKNFQNFFDLLHQFTIASNHPCFSLESKFPESLFSLILLELVVIYHNQEALNIITNLLASSSQEIVSNFLVEKNFHIFLTGHINKWTVVQSNELICSDLDFFICVLNCSVNFVAASTSNSQFVMSNSLSSFQSLCETHDAQLVKASLRIFSSSLNHETDVSMRMNLMEFVSLWFLNLINLCPIWTLRLLAQMSTYPEFFEIFNESDVLSFLLQDFKVITDPSVLKLILLIFWNVVSVEQGDTIDDFFVQYYQKFIDCLSFYEDQDLLAIIFSIFASICSFLSSEQIMVLIQTSLSIRDKLHGLYVWNFGLAMCQYLKCLNDEEVVKMVSAGFNELLLDLSMTDHVQLFISTMGTIIRIVGIELSASNIGGEFTEMLRNEDLFCLLDSFPVQTNTDAARLLENLLTLIHQSE